MRHGDRISARVTCEDPSALLACVTIASIGEAIEDIIGRTRAPATALLSSPSSHLSFFAIGDD